MKQGRAETKREGWKTEPHSTKANLDGVSNLGLSRQFRKEEALDGPGFNPTTTSRPALGPGGGRTVHPSGSQGKHK